ncbi:unnamed protein product [Thlaspi arvense]|uniref:Neprosin PEP catalytic domain-containing protein n=1 Tax=Thlaspi arvense TaxID=13288 RepID=A0AAU9RLP6_THLAR|nr:unnamed protein product [Thlaspi arvense]
MASLWLTLFSLGLICLGCIAEPTLVQEPEFECVPMYEQPALQLPLMKNHQIQMKPSRELLSVLSTSNNDTTTKIILKGSKGCSKGQVPVHKPKTNVTDNLIYPQQLTKDYNQHYAIIKTFGDTITKWSGAQALFNIIKPPVAKNQYSRVWIWLNYNVMSSIQFGVAVDTILYRDNRPRLTTYWMSDKQQNGCYNALCPGGYVQVHKSIYPGMIFDKVSVPGGIQHTFHLSVAEDPVTKNWVLTTGTIMIGYWPRQAYMAKGAGEVYFGGFAGTASPRVLSPPMGTGDFPTKDLTRSCFMKQLKYVIPGYTLEDINSNEMEYYVNNQKCYGVMFLKYVDYDSRETLTFGGPGGYCPIR